MATYILGAVLLICFCFALKGVAKHFRGESACCGGGEAIEPPKKQLTEPVIGEKIIHIEGMTCKNCKIRVENLLNELQGGAATVNLNRGLATLAMSRNISDEEIYQKLADSEYKITAITAK